VLAVVVVIAVVIVASSGGSTTKAQAAAAPGSALTIKQTPLGKTLTDANGRILYLFAADKHNLSTLSAAGRAAWPPFTSRQTPQALNGANAALISTVKGAGGTPQISYNGHPLYYFVGDHKPGQTSGQGLNEFGARWYVLGPGGAAVTAAPVHAAPAPASSGGSYGY
jgi:predicted lipoprotein with Yx(FWY)xxD motif